MNLSVLQKTRITLEFCNCGGLAKRLLCPPRNPVAERPRAVLARNIPVAALACFPLAIFLHCRDFYGL